MLPLYLNVSGAPWPRLNVDGVWGSLTTVSSLNLSSSFIIFLWKMLAVGGGGCFIEPFVHWEKKKEKLETVVVVVDNFEMFNERHSFECVLFLLLLLFSNGNSIALIYLIPIFFFLFFLFSGNMFLLRLYKMSPHDQRTKSTFSERLNAVQSAAASFAY